MHAMLFNMEQERIASHREFTNLCERTAKIYDIVSSGHIQSQSSCPITPNSTLPTSRATSPSQVVSPSLDRTPSPVRPAKIARLRATHDKDHAFPCNENDTLLQFEESSQLAPAPEKSFLTMTENGQFPRHYDERFKCFFIEQLHLCYAKDLRGNHWKTISQGRNKSCKSLFMHAKELVKSCILIAGKCPREKPKMAVQLKIWISGLDDIIQIVQSQWPALLMRLGFSLGLTLNQTNITRVGKKLCLEGAHLPPNTPTAFQELLETCLTGTKGNKRKAPEVVEEESPVLPE